MTAPTGVERSLAAQLGKDREIEWILSRPDKSTETVSNGSSNGNTSQLDGR